MPDMPEIQWIRVPTADKRGPVERWLRHVAGIVSDPDHAILRGCDNHDAPAHHVVVRHSPPDVKEATRQYCDSCYENELIDGCDVLAVVHLPADDAGES